MRRALGSAKLAVMDDTSIDGNGRKPGTQFRFRRDHVALMPPSTTPMLRHQAGQSTETRMGQRIDVIQRAATPAHGLVQGAGSRVLLAGGMPCGP